MDSLRSKLNPQRGQQVKVEERPGVRAWKTFFSDLQIDARGHARAPAIRQEGCDSTRYFRLVRGRR
eukprot:1875075-Alexandrium_andersonii.AAC.1